MLNSVLGKPDARFAICLILSGITTLGIFWGLGALEGFLQEGVNGLLAEEPTKWFYLASAACVFVIMLKNDKFDANPADFFVVLMGPFSLLTWVYAWLWSAFFPPKDTQDTD